MAADNDQGCFDRVRCGRVFPDLVSRLRLVQWFFFVRDGVGRRASAGCRSIAREAQYCVQHHRERKNEAARLYGDLPGKDRHLRRCRFRKRLCDVAPAQI
jgi:hypothetical protein